MSELLQKEENANPFSYLEDMDINPDGQSGAASKDDAAPAESKDEKVSISKEEYKELMDKVNKVSSGPGLDDEKLAKIMENNRIVEAMRSAILPDEGEVKASQRRKQEDAFDSDPIGFIRQVLKYRLSNIYIVIGICSLTKKSIHSGQND